MAFSKIARRNKIKARIRGKISGTAERPRMTVFRSNKQIYVQLVNDLEGKTLVARSSKNLVDFSRNKVEQAAAVGKLIGAAAIEAGITKVVFDRNGYLYHGRVESLANAAREAVLSSNSDGRQT